VGFVIVPVSFISYSGIELPGACAIGTFFLDTRRIIATEKNEKQAMRKKVNDTGW